MDISWLSKVILLSGALLLSAFFSVSEVVLFSFDEAKLRAFRKSNKITSGYIQALLEYPRRLLVTLQLGSTITNTMAVVSGLLLSFEIANDTKTIFTFSLLLHLIILIFLVLLFGEIIPRLIGDKYPVFFAKITALPLYWISIILYPAAKILSDLLGIFYSKIKTDKYPSALQSTELSELTELSVEKGEIEEEEHELIQGIVDFKNISVREIMTPRVDIISVSIQDNIDNLMKLISESGFSRIPLYKDNLDNIIGIIYAKDLLPYLKNAEMRKTFSLSKIAREAMFVPETKPIKDLLHEFQEKKMHIGIVVDEYGGTAGLISLEDILEEIVGDIRDEYDREEKQIIKVNENSYLLQGRVQIDELNDLLGNDFSSANEDYDTVGGFIFNHAGNIPRQGFHFVHNNYKFTVKEVVNKRINKVLVEKLN
ncbi:MAG: hemolysin family protein [Bacteroidota bacterium]